MTDRPTVPGGGAGDSAAVGPAPGQAAQPPGTSPAVPQAGGPRPGGPQAGGPQPAGPQALGPPPNVGERLRALARRMVAWGQAARGSGSGSGSGGAGDGGDGGDPVSGDPSAQHQPPGEGGLAGRSLAGPPGGLRQAPDEQVPRLLRQLAAWAWRLILVAILIYGAFRVAVELRLVVLPLIAALLLTALLQPLSARLRRAGLPALLATWCTFLAAIVIIAGVVTLTANRVSADYPALAAEVKRTATQVQHSLAGPPFHLNAARLQHLTNQLVNFISQHKSVIAGTVLTGGRIFLETLTGLILTLFISFFLLKDGAKIWSWVIGGLRPEAHRRVSNAGDAAWHALTNYIRGTTVVAAIHAIFIGLALWLLGVPLLVPLIILVFFAAYVPLIGILVIGALAILVTLATQGWIAAVILLAVFLLENQIESHLLQPLVVGRAVRLHPLAIILVLAVGGVIAGIPGAIVAVPAAAVITYAWPSLREAEPVSAPES